MPVGKRVLQTYDVDSPVDAHVRYQKVGEAIVMGDVVVRAPEAHDVALDSSTKHIEIASQIWMIFYEFCEHCRRAAHIRQPFPPGCLTPREKMGITGYQRIADDAGVAFYINSGELDEGRNTTSRHEQTHAISVIEERDVVRRL